MVTLLAGIFIKDKENTSSPEVRQAYGMLTGIVGIFLNICLFAGKFIAGTISSSISITADAFNNLSDAGSSFVTLIGFKLAGAKPDPDHPFGHGRIEYVSGLIVSGVILLMAFELIKNSVDKIIHPTEVEFSLLAMGILVASILVKIYMYFYNQQISKKIDSAAMKATAVDSLSDTLATTVVLIAAIVAKYTGLQVDGYCGVLVGLFIFYAGFSAAKDTLDPLLGQPAEPEFVERIEEIVNGYDMVLGIHDLVVHNYGPGRVFVTLHAEVPYTMNLLAAHDIIDIAEHRVAGQLHCGISIHMDPVVNDDKEVEELKEMVLEVIAEIDDRLSIHDFRSTKGPYLTNLIFDLVVPHQYKYTDKEVQDMVHNAIQKKNPKCFAVVTVERSYIK